MSLELLRNSRLYRTPTRVPSQAWQTIFVQHHVGVDGRGFWLTYGELCRSCASTGAGGERLTCGSAASLRASLQKVRFCWLYGTPYPTSPGPLTYASSSRSRLLRRSSLPIRRP